MLSVNYTIHLILVVSSKICITLNIVPLEELYNIVAFKLVSSFLLGLTNLLSNDFNRYTFEKKKKTAKQQNER